MKNTPFTVPFDYCHRWIRAAFNMVEKHFSFFILLGIVCCVATVVIGLLPYIGAIAAPVLRFVFILGSLRLMQHLFEKQPATIETFFNYCFDLELLKKLQKPLLACAASGLLMEIGVYVHIPFFYWLAVLVSLCIPPIAFAAYYNLRFPDVDLKDSLHFVFQQTGKNIANLILLVLFLTALSVASALLCIVPLFLFYLPMTFPLYYLVYMGLCENKSIESLSESWNSDDSSPLR